MYSSFILNQVDFIFKLKTSFTFIEKLTLPVRPSDDIFQECILRGHESPPGPRHSCRFFRSVLDL